HSTVHVCDVALLDLPPCPTRRSSDLVFYVQYAHARTHQVARNARESGVDRGEFEPETLTHETESVLLGLLAEFPRIVAHSAQLRDRKSTRLNSSHVKISYAVFCLKKK